MRSFPFITSIAPRYAGQTTAVLSEDITGRPLTVVQVLPSLNPAMGGPSVAAVNTAIAVGRAGNRNVFAFSFDSGDLPKVESAVHDLRVEGVKVIGFPVTRAFGSFARRWGISLPLARWLTRAGKDFDVIHAHGAWTFGAVAGLTIARIYRRTAVLSPHESLTDFDVQKSPPAKRLLKRLLRRLYLRVFDVVITASLLEQGDTARKSSKRVVVVSHALGEEKMDSHARSSRRPGELRIGFLGRFDPKKNIELLIEAVGASPDAVTLWLAGDGPAVYRRELERLAQEEGAAPRVEWLGFIESDAKQSFLASIDLLAMPSDYESFGVAAAEALTAGVPVLVSPRTGVAKIVRSYRCGAVVPTDAERIRASVLGILENPDILEEWGSRAAAAAQREFSIERHGMSISRAYRTASRRRTASHRRPSSELTTSSRNRDPE
jgi:glycosyltransferase involved in cell wall biosynthesis